MTANVEIAQVLAASDWQTIAAIVVFTVISIVANWVKKRSEANAPSSPAQADADEEFEPVEVFDESRPIRRAPPIARPTAPPIPVAGPRRMTPYGERPELIRSRTSEAQDRVNSVLQMPKVSVAPAIRVAEKARPQKAARVAVPQAAVPEADLVNGKGILDLHNPRSLRQAVVAAELLKPPMALRGTPDLPGLTP
ncbi:MAG TPA: hypothetical protein VJZ71_02770 [Phycisphaerae bacterium]|nr:hypothetical protein [Phycisphaerae bacterium]